MFEASYQQHGHLNGWTKSILQELYDVNFGGFLKTLYCHMGGSRGD